jgi:hypothetical protein
VTDRGDEFPTAEPGASGLAVLHREVAVRPRDVEVVISPDLVADLYDPTLVISHGYVGPDRRRHARPAPRRATQPWYSRIMTVLLLTAMVVVPLTLIAARSVPPAVAGSSTGPGAGQVAPRATAREHRLERHVFTASSQQVARAVAAYQRALARAGATGRAVTPPGATGGVVSPAGAIGAAAGVATQADSSATGAQQQQMVAANQQAAAVAANQQAAALASQQRAAAADQVAQERAATRAADEAAAEARREARAAARAQAQTARAAARGAAASGGTVPPDGNASTGTAGTGAPGTVPSVPEGTSGVPSVGSTGG